MMAQKLTTAWGQQAVVDNRAGAAGMIGSGFAARAAPDGYTLLLTTLDTLAIIPHITRKPLYDSLRDFAEFLRTDFEKWGKVVAAAGVRPE